MSETELIRQCWQALRGDGVDPESGLVSKVNRLSRSLDDLREEITLLREDRIRFKVHQRLLWVMVGFVASSIFSIFIVKLF
jgi:hypothetical protein